MHRLNYQLEDTDSSSNESVGAGMDDMWATIKQLGLTEADSKLLREDLCFEPMPNVIPYTVSSIIFRQRDEMRESFQEPPPLTTFYYLPKDLTAEQKQVLASLPASEVEKQKARFNYQNNLGSYQTCLKAVSRETGKPCLLIQAMTLVAQREGAAPKQQGWVPMLPY